MEVYGGGTVARPRLVSGAWGHSRTLYHPRGEARGAGETDVPCKGRDMICQCALGVVTQASVV